MSHSVLDAPAPTLRRLPASLLVLLALLTVSLVGRLVFTLAEPPFDGSLRYDDLAAMDGAWWPLNLYLGGPSYLFSFVTTAVFLALLGRGRGALPTLVGALMVGLGGALFSLALTAEALPFGYATDPAVFDETQGRALVEVFNGQTALVPAIVGGQLVLAVGGLVALAGVLVSGTTPRWFPVVGVLVVLATQLLPLGPAGYIAQLVLLGAIGWFAVRRVARS